MNIAIHGERELLVRWTYEAGRMIDEQHYIDRSYLLDGCIYVCNYRLQPVTNHYHLTPSNYNEILNIIIERKDEKRNKV